MLKISIRKQCSRGGAVDPNFVAGSRLLIRCPNLENAFAAGDDACAVGAEGDRHDEIGMAAKGSSLFAGMGIPEDDGVAVAVANLSRLAEGLTAGGRREPLSLCQFPR